MRTLLSYRSTFRVVDEGSLHAGHTDNDSGVIHPWDIVAQSERVEVLKRLPPIQNYQVVFVSTGEQEECLRYLGLGPNSHQRRRTEIHAIHIRKNTKPTLCLHSCFSLVVLAIIVASHSAFVFAWCPRTVVVALRWVGLAAALQPFLQASSSPSLSQWSQTSFQRPQTSLQEETIFLSKL